LVVPPIQPNLNPTGQQALNKEPIYTKIKKLKIKETKVKKATKPQKYTKAKAKANATKKLETKIKTKK